MVLPQGNEDDNDDDEDDEDDFDGSQKPSADNSRRNQVRDMPFINPDTVSGRARDNSRPTQRRHAASANPDSVSIRENFESLMTYFIPDQRTSRAQTESGRSNIVIGRGHIVATTSQ